MFFNLININKTKRKTNIYMYFFNLININKINKTKRKTNIYMYRFQLNMQHKQN